MIITDITKLIIDDFATSELFTYIPGSITGNINFNGHFMVANTLMYGQTYYVKVTPSQWRDTTINDYTLQVKQFAKPNDTMFDAQNHILNTQSGFDANVLPAWELLNGAGFTIAVADSGIDYNHADLRNNLNLSLSYNSMHSTPDIFPTGETSSSVNAAGNGHGTHVAGIIGATTNNGEGVSGVFPNATLIGYKVLGTRIDGNPNYTGSVTSFVNAIADAKEKGVRLMNCSFGGAGASATEKEAMANAPDILFVTAVGNSGYDLDIYPIYPACYTIDHILAVAALDSNGNLASYSNYGNPVHVAAQGTDVFSTMSFGAYENKVGTSQATPIATSACAMIMAKNPELTTAQVKNIVANPNAVTELPALQGKVKSGGAVNAFKALALDKELRDIQSVEESHRDVFEDRDVKSVIAEVMQRTPATQKTANLIVKFKNIDDEDRLVEIVREETGHSINFVAEIPLVGSFEYATDSIEAAEELVAHFNAYSSVAYAELNYIRMAE